MNDVSNTVPLWRLYALRAIYLLNFALLGMSAWTELLNNYGNWDPMDAVGYSFWAALSLLSLLGIKYPLKMLPIIILQFTYKSIWMIFIGLPQWSSLSLDFIRPMLIGVVIEIILIPWAYVWKQYISGKSTRWK